MLQKKTNQYFIPNGKFEVDDEQLKRKREELKKKLREGKKVVVEPSGNVNPNENNTGNNIQIPPGKLAFYWYEDKPQLLQEEIASMKNFFPQFRLEKFDEDGRLYWHGMVTPEVLGGTQWYLQLIYDNSHPHKNNYGGSVKVYSIEPDLDELAADFYEANSKVIPHLLTDGAGHKYMCTSDKEDFHSSATKTTSAASCLAWGMKWIACYELLISEDNTQKWNELYSNFSTHGNF